MAEKGDLKVKGDLDTQGDKGAGKPNDPMAKPSPVSEKAHGGQSQMAAQAEANKAATPDRADARPGQTPPETKLAQTVHETQEAEHKDVDVFNPMPPAIPTAINQSCKGKCKILSAEELPDRKFKVKVETDGGKMQYLVGRDGNIFSAEICR